MVCETCLARFTGRDLQLDCPAGCLTIGGLHLSTVQALAYESPRSRSIPGQAPPPTRTCAARRSGSLPSTGWPGLIRAASVRRVGPAQAVSHGDLERHREVGRAAHGRSHDPLHPLKLTVCDLEQQLVMYLQQHA
jgi:hypothetical protein